MASVVNLNRFRKTKKRAAAKQRAAENRTAFGRTKLDEYNERVASKGWRELWPKVRFVD